MTGQRVRPFAAEDIAQVSELHRGMFRDGEHTPELERSYRCFFRDVYLENPWYDEGLSSLVCEDGNGKVIGFLGVMPRPIRVNGRSLRAAVSSMFMVAPPTVAFSAYSGCPYVMPWMARVYNLPKWPPPTFVGVSDDSCEYHAVR